jgi:hypothetical protein
MPPRQGKVLILHIFAEKDFTAAGTVNMSWRVNFTRQQWLVTFTFIIVNFCNAMCVSMQASCITHMRA